MVTSDLPSDTSSIGMLYCPVGSETVGVERSAIALQFLAGRDVPMLMLSFFRRGQNLLKGFRTTDFDATFQQLPPYAVLYKELVQLSSEVLVHAES